MDDPSRTIEKVRGALAPHGLFLRGAVAPEGAAASVLADGRQTRSILLVGNIGGAHWPAFERWRLGQPDHGGSDPLDRWSEEVIRPIAADLGATALFPSDRPWQPFQQWAMQAEGLRASPLGILIHPVFGLWHGYRGALAFADSALSDALQLPTTIMHPCDLCRDRPCLSSCPVDAVGPDRFDVAACREFLGREATCRARGCLARNACPVGAEFRYGPQQLQFHMAALKAF